jgi:hypothetical protein
MTHDPVRAALLDAYSELELHDSVAQVIQRGQRVRRARRRTTLGAAAALALAGAIVLANAGTTRSNGTALQLAAADLPAVPVSLSPAPAGLRQSTDLDGGRLRLLYVGASRTEIVLSTSNSAPKAAADIPSATVLTWRYSDELWVTLTGFDHYDDRNMLRRLQPRVISRPVSLAMQLTAAPEGWRVTAYKDTLPRGGVATFSDPDAPDTGSLIIDVAPSAYSPVEPGSLNDPGRAETVIVQGRSASLVKGHSTWYLRAALDGDTTVTLQAPRQLTKSQVIQIADGVRRTR